MTSRAEAIEKAAPLAAEMLERCERIAHEQCVEGCVSKQAARALRAALSLPKDDPEPEVERVELDSNYYFPKAGDSLRKADGWVGYAKRPRPKPKPSLAERLRAKAKDETFFGDIVPLLREAADRLEEVEGK